MELDTQGWNPKLMTSAVRKKVHKQLRSTTGKSGTITFKYYIHDTSDGYELELAGPLTESSIPELSCCWQTARTTLKNRKLTFDVTAVTFVDEGAKQWLASMTQEGARYVPETFLLDAVASQPSAERSGCTVQNIFLRLASALRSGV